MGRSTESDVCCHVLRTPYEWFPPFLDEDQYGENVLQYGWYLRGCVPSGQDRSLYADEYFKVREGKLYVVHAVNEDEYAAGGGMEFTVFGSPRERFASVQEGGEDVARGGSRADAVKAARPDLSGLDFATPLESDEEFKSDFGLDGPISEMAAVQQTS